MNVSSHRRQPWYNDFVKDQHRIIRNRERVWRTHTNEATWKAYKIERNIYVSLLTYHKRQSLSKKINEIGNDTKQLYKFTNNWMGVKEENPLPPHEDDQALAEEFAKFFLIKILNIRNKFTDDTYCPEMVDIPRLTKFSTLTESEVGRIIMEMQTKSCELDPKPTHILKQLLPVCLTIITRFVNLFLDQSYFHRDWKTSIVRPLIKKVGMELVNKTIVLLAT